MSASFNVTDRSPRFRVESLGFSFCFEIFKFEEVLIDKLFIYLIQFKIFYFISLKVFSIIRDVSGNRFKQNL